MNNTEAGQTMSDGRQPKHVELLQIHNQLMDIYQHICDLNVKLGVINRKESKMPPPPVSDIPKMPEPNSLVSVLDQLPGMVSGKVTQIHSLLNDLEENLT